MFSLSFRYRNDTVLQSHGGIKGTAHIISRMIHMHIGIKLHTWVSHRALSTCKGPMWRPCMELSSFLKMQRDSFHLTSVLTASLVSARWAPSVAREKKACFFYWSWDICMRKRRIRFWKSWFLSVWVCRFALELLPQHCNLPLRVPLMCPCTSTDCCFHRKHVWVANSPTG